jgi:glycosyltransferase involved in cell wall biosynthesis
MRIAMIHTPLMGRGGGERQILRLTIELQKLGHEVEIFTNAVNEKACYPNLLNKVTINVISHPLVRFKPYRKIAIINIGRNMPKRFDIINNHNFPTEWAAFFAKARLKIPVVWMCNEPPYWFWRPEQREGRHKINWPLYEIFDKIAVKYIDKIVVLSRVAECLVRKAYNMSSEIVRSGVDIELFHNASGEEVRKKYGFENDFVLLHVGYIDTRRRQSDSVEALYHLSKNYDNVKLILDGTGSREALIRLSEQLGVRNKVLFLHSVSDEELAKMYAACDVFVFPSQITWGLAAVEAMAAAKPVVVSEKAGASEIIQNGVNGIVVDHAKPEEIAKQVELLMNNPKICKKLGEKAYEYVKNNLSWEKYAQNMERIFRQTILNFKGNL